MSTADYYGWLQAARKRAHRTEDAPPFIVEAPDRADAEIARRLDTDPEYARMDDEMRARHVPK